MPHFSDTFHVKPDLSRGEIRVSVRVSENRVDEWWISAIDVREVIALEGQDGWRGDGSLKIRFNNGSADVALYDAGGNRTVIRAFSSAVKLFLAQLRACVSEVPVSETEERVVLQSRGADEEIVKEAVRLAVQGEIAAMRAAVLQAIRDEVGGLKSFMASAPSVPESIPQEVSGPSLETKVFIPSTVGKKDLEGSMKAKTGSTGGVSEAVEALKGLKGDK